MMAQGVPEGPVCAEIFAVHVTPDGATWFSAGDAETWCIDVDPRDNPLETAREAVTDALAAPIVMHSTSWRHEDGCVVLTFLAVVEGRSAPRDGTWVPVRRARLARGEPDEAPDETRSAQVLEHAMRHLAWLVDDDPQVAGVLPDGWAEVLRAYAPQPFHGHA